MTTVELIHELRAQAEVEEPGTLYHLLHGAADRLEELEERLDIVSVDAAATEEQLNHHDQEIRALNKTAERLHGIGIGLLIMDGLLILALWIMKLVNG